MKRRRTSWLILLLLTLCASSVRAQVQPLDGLDAYIEKAMREWRVPGLALGVVEGDSVVWAKGYGVRDIGTRAPVDEHTLFAIASATKPFTVASLAMLVSEGKLSWDDPVTELLPGFRLHDPYVTREITVRDLLSHRGGLPEPDRLFAASTSDRAEVVRRLRYLEPSFSFRSRFGYQNSMFTVAGHLVPALTDLTWEEFVQKRIFDPLGMRSSNTSVEALEAETNVATPYAVIDDAVQEIPWDVIHSDAPAGAINSSIADMTRWIRLQLGRGSFEGNSLIDPKLIEEMRTPQTIIRRKGFWDTVFPPGHFLTYGLGWFVYDYHGYKVVDHGGAVDGMQAMVALLPDKQLGLVVLTNLDWNMLPEALRNRIFDAYLGLPEQDWSSKLLEKEREYLAREEAEEKRLEEARVPGTKPLRSLERYIGTYENEIYGRVTVERGADDLVLHFTPSLVADLEHWHYDVFRAVWRNEYEFWRKTFVTFVLGPRGEVEEMRVEDVADFKRVYDSNAGPGSR